MRKKIQHLFDATQSSIRMRNYSEQRLSPKRIDNKFLHPCGESNPGHGGESAGS